MSGAVSDPGWNARAYHVLSEPQFAWGLPVLERLPLAGHETVLDAGCGSGRLTARLLDRLPRGRVIALDRSRAMLVEAAPMLDAARALRVHADLLAVPLAHAVDAVFSTATFHWVPDEAALYRQLHGALKPGGVLEAQCGGGDNVGTLRRRARTLMERAEWAPHFRDWSPPWRFSDPPTAERHLREAGFVDVRAWLEPAPTRFPEEAAWRAFTRNVVIRHEMASLPDDAARDRFMDALAAEYARDPDGWQLDYVRLNLSARRAR